MATNDKPETSKAPFKPGTELSIGQRILGVCAEVPHIKHDKWVGKYLNNGEPDPSDSYGYWVTTHHAVNAALAPLLVRWGLIDYISEDRGKNVDTGRVVGQNNVPMFQHRGHYTYTVEDAARPGEKISVQVSGYGDDMGDKGPGKAQTYAFKAARTKMFNISTGEDEEGRPQEQHTKPKEPVSTEQFDQLLQVVDGFYGDDSEDFLKRFGAGILKPLFDVEALIELPAEHFEHAVRLIENQAKRDGRNRDDSDNV